MTVIHIKNTAVKVDIPYKCYSKIRNIVDYEIESIFMRKFWRTGEIPIRTSNLIMYRILCILSLKGW